LYVIKKWFETNQCFPRLLPTGGFWSWKFELVPFTGNGEVKLIGALKFKLAVGGFVDEPIAILVADGTGVELSQTVTIYILTLLLLIHLEML